MSVLALVSELTTQSQLAAAAARTGVELEVVATTDAVLAAIDPPSPTLVILDLSHPGLNPTDLIPRLRTALPTTPLLAFGPHVHKDRLEAARAAGCHTVLSRGEFHARMDALISGGR